MAVFTKLSRKEIETHLEQYQIGELIDFKEIVEGIDNSNFIITTNQNKFILTIFESRINSEELPFFINLKLHLASKKICCPAPILNKNGVALVNLKNKKSIIVNFLEGKILQASEDGYYRDIEEKHCFEIGNILAKLHLASQDFSMKRQNDLSLEGWQKLFSKIKPHLNNYQIGLSEEIENYLNFIEKNWNHNFPKFAVHVDLFPDNVFFNEEKKVSGVIDFYFAASDSFIYDFAVVVCAWCFDEKNIFDQQKFLQLKNGYELVRKFSNQEEKFLKIALIGASMRFLLTRLHDMIFTPKDSIVKIKNPQEFLEKLRFFKKEYGN